MTATKAKGLAADPTGIRLPAGGLEQITAELDAAPHRFGIVVSRYNDFSTRALAQSAVDVLKAHGAAETGITVVWVPGAFEIPFALERLARQKKFSALLAIGAIIQGETPHASLIATEVTHALADISRRYDVPVIDAILFAHNVAQAEARSGDNENSRGRHAARAAIEMANLAAKL